MTAIGTLSNFSDYFGTNSTSNFTKSSRSVCQYRSFAGLRIAAYALVTFISLCGNSLIVTVITKQKLTKKSPHLFILNMAIADLVVTVTYLPRMLVRMVHGDLWIVTGTFGLVLCRTIPFLFHVTILVSVFTIFGASVDRFCAMMFPLRHIITRRTVKVIVVLSWVIAAIIRFFYLFAPYLKPARNGFTCTPGVPELLGEKAQIYYDFLLWLYLVIFLNIIVLYAVSIIILKRSKSIGASNDTAQARKLKASEKLLKILIVVTICFVCCWVLYFFADIFFERPHPCEVRFVRLFLAHSNSALNPCILFAMNEQFRDGCKNLFKKSIDLIGISESRSLSRVMENG